MTKQEIITLLIKDYEEAIEKCKGMEHNEVVVFLDKINMDFGVCLYSFFKYGFNLSDKQWVVKHIDLNTERKCYWTNPIWVLDNKESIIQSLQTRLNILKTELEIPE